jgi:hypothetical protein
MLHSLPYSCKLNVGDIRMVQQRESAKTHGNTAVVAAALKARHWICYSAVELRCVWLLWLLGFGQLSTTTALSYASSPNRSNHISHCR